MVNPDQYDYIIVAFSGGKDSLACILHLLELGVPKEKIELWHHEVDGRESGHFMDWTVTPGYCRAVANALGLPIYYSWRTGGFRGEMLRENRKTLPIRFEVPGGQIKESGGKGGKKSTRRLFPMVTSKLRYRWCSAYLKIEAGRAAMNNQARFNNKKTLMITGERAQESVARSKYKQFEIMDHCDTARSKMKVNESKREKSNRYVDAWRPVFNWDITEVWKIIERWNINPHPCYKMGWGRCSCAGCIFGKPDQFASLMHVDPNCFWQMFNHESEFDRSIKYKTKTINGVKSYINQSILDYAMKGTPFHMNPEDIQQVNSENYYQPVFVKHWEYPSGAFADQETGPS
jgi:3'-phosphoadenosine 5'-phosphosulfate sulfotransferase (PAPS reductase)/FAD synthetase